MSDYYIKVRNQHGEEQTVRTSENTETMTAERALSIAGDLANIATLGLAIVSRGRVKPKR